MNINAGNRKQLVFNGYYRFSGQFRCVYIGYDAELLLV